MKKRAEAIQIKFLTLFKNLSLRWKIFFIVLLNVVSLLLFSFIGFTILSKTYNELLYRSIAGNLSFSANTISTNLKDVERLSSIILSTSSIQTSLSAIHESEDAVVRSMPTEALTPPFHPIMRPSVRTESPISSCLTTTFPTQPTGPPTKRLTGNLSIMPCKTRSWETVRSAGPQEAAALPAFFWGEISGKSKASIFLPSEGS